MIYQGLAWLALWWAAAAPPGVVIDHCPASTGQYIGSPSIAILPDGRYVASHDFFGPNSGHKTAALTRIFRSGDRGRTWRMVAEIRPAFWSTLFVHRGALYLIGTTHENGDTVIRRSADGGESWTSPKDERSGLLLRGQYHCAPQPVLVHKGRIWRAMEDASGPGGWGRQFSAFMMSAPVEADLLDASSWTFSNRLPSDPAWLGGRLRGWLEGNAVADPEGRVWDVLRVDVPEGGIAAMVEISPDGREARFDAGSGFIAFPGGAKKFTIRYDARSRLYWSLANWVPERYRGPHAATVRNTLALISSPDLKSWTIRRVVLEHPDRDKHGFQYADWQFDGKDLIAVVRTAFDDGQGGAPRAHDANYLTFHRIRDFRKAGKLVEFSGPRQGELTRGGDLRGRR